MNSRRYAAPRLACALVVVALLGACSGPTGGTPGTASASSAAAVPVSSSGAALLAPDFTLETLEGERVTLSALEGEVRLIDFWATWCAPCREEIPMLNQLQASYGDRGFRVLAIAEEDLLVLQEFAEEHDMRYTKLVGTADVSLQYKVLGLPTAYLVDGQGKIVETFFGPKPAKKLEQRIRELLDAATGT